MNAIKNNLTKREIEIIKLLAQGLSSVKIAEQLIISKRTVETHIGNIFTKLNLDNRIKAILLAIQEGIVEV